MSHRFLPSLLLSGFSLLLSGCLVTFAPASPTETPTVAPTATVTPIWFPPTATPSPFPTPQAEPTTDLRPGIGTLLFQDDFSDPALWTTTAGDSQAVVTVADGTIHLGLNKERSYLLPTRISPVLDNFYAEIAAEPSLCHGEDEYGFLVRANGQDQYRFAMSCDGRAKVDRYLNGSLSRLEGWVSNGAIPSVIPGQVRLAVWAAGEDLRFFINDLYLFSIRDTQIYTGTLGVFVHTSGTGGVSVSFSNLQVWSLN